MEHCNAEVSKSSVTWKHMCKPNFKNTAMKHLTMYLSYPILHLQEQLAYFLEVFLWFMISIIAFSSLLLQFLTLSYCTHTCKSLPLQTYSNVQNISLFPWKIVSVKLPPCCYNCTPTSFDRQIILILSSQKVTGQSCSYGCNTSWNISHPLVMPAEK